MSYTFIGTEAGDRSSISISSAGDVDGDGLDDLLIGANQASGTFGETYLVTAVDLAAADAADGTTDGVIDLDNINEQSTSYQFIGTLTGDRSGNAVSSAGDVDGDGLDDLLIGASEADGVGSNSGEAYLVTAADLAAADAADGTIDGVIDLENVNEQNGSYEFTGTAANDLAGRSVSSIGDVDGDGLDDFIIGAPGGADIYLVTAADLAAADAADGTTDGLVDLNNVNEQNTSYQFTGSSADLTGYSISSAGDVDGDGFEDLLIGARGGDGGGSNSGHTYLITVADLAAADAADGITDGVISLSNIDEQSTSYRFFGDGQNDSSGISVSSAGDVDGDGLDDLIIGTVGNNSSTDSGGGAYLVTAADLIAADAADGSTDGTIRLGNIDEQSTSYLFLGTERFDSAGVSVSSAGDVDGDGLDDLIIGANRADDGGTSSGEAYLVTAVDLAAADAADGTIDGQIDLDNINEQSTSYQFVGADADDFAGGSVSSAGDVDGDGLDDLLIGALGADGGGSTSGEAYLISAAELVALDAADGTTDGVIDLGNASIVPCFTSGTLIRTQSSDVPIEDVSVGDLVETYDNGLQPVRWIGSTKRAAIGNMAPILIRKGALGNARDLRVSPQHRMLYSGWQAEILFGKHEILVTAKSLINDHSIISVEGGEVEYFHILFDSHEIIFAEGSPTESFHPGKQSWDALGEATTAEILTLFPQMSNIGDFSSYGPVARTSLKHYQGLVLGECLRDAFAKNHSIIAPSMCAKMPKTQQLNK